MHIKQELVPGLVQYLKTKYKLEVEEDESSFKIYCGVALVPVSKLDENPFIPCNWGGVLIDYLVGLIGKPEIPEAVLDDIRNLRAAFVKLRSQTVLNPEHVFNLTYPDLADFLKSQQ